jgi:hypothetical protein
MTAPDDKRALSAEEREELRAYAEADSLDRFGVSAWVLRLLAEHAALTAALARMKDVSQFAQTQATTCAVCLVYKHTPVRRDSMGGYVCGGCLEKELDALTAALATRDAHILELAEGVNGLANDAADRARERDAARAELAEAREALKRAGGSEDGGIRYCRGPVEEGIATIARDFAEVEEQLTACRRERDDAQKASMAPLLLRLAVAPRFWTKVNLNGPVPPHKPRLGKCWIWTASTSSGYGKFKAGYKWHRAHRFSYECATGTVIATGDDPQDTSVMHLCDNTLCVNPRHLALGTHLDNVRDCVKKGRNRPYRGGPFAGKKAANE